MCLPPSGVEAAAAGEAVSVAAAQQAAISTATVRGIIRIVVAVWSWAVWPRFGKAIWDDERAWDAGTPTGFLWVHAVLIVSALAIGTTVGVLGVKGWRRATRPD
jgi:hypothetical protein